MLGSCISAMYGVVAGASTKLGCDSSVTIASLRRGGFAVGPDSACESTGRRECSAKSVAKMIFSRGSDAKADARLGDSTG
jgi:hypothetical protein